MIWFFEGAQAGIVLNEVLPNPSGEDAGHEWLEITNIGEGVEDLSGVTIDVAIGEGDWQERYVIPSLTWLGPDEFLTIGESDVIADIQATLSLGNASQNPAYVRLRLGEDILDELGYGGTDGIDCAPQPGIDESIARIPDGVGEWHILALTTLGSANQSICSVSDAVRINELMANPEGSDESKEWIELLNLSSESLDIGGWRFDYGTTGFSHSVTLPTDTTLAEYSYLVVGEIDVPESEVLTELMLGNAGSNADAIRLVDCFGNVVDTVVYGSVNDDEWVDELGFAESLAPKPEEGDAIARIPDGQDTNRSGDDFQIVEPTPGQPALPIPELLSCESSNKVVLNEVFVNPIGLDGGQEWVELFAAEPVDLSNWSLEIWTSAEDVDLIVFPNDTQIDREFLVIGNAEFSDLWFDIVLPNGIHGDSIRLLDCAGQVIDAIAYGVDNTDQVPAESGVATEWMTPTASGSALARAIDGMDTNQLTDWREQTPTPGLTNVEEEQLKQTALKSVSPGCSTVPSSSIGITGLLWIGWRRHGKKGKKCS